MEGIYVCACVYVCVCACVCMCVCVCVGMCVCVCVDTYIRFGTDLLRFVTDREFGHYNGVIVRFQVSGKHANKGGLSSSFIHYTSYINITYNIHHTLYNIIHHISYIIHHTYAHSCIYTHIHKHTYIHL